MIGSNFFKGLSNKTTRTNAHCCTISITSVWLCRIRINPSSKHSSISTITIWATNLFHIKNRFLRQIFKILFRFNQSLRDSKHHDRIICKFTIFMKNFKIFSFMVTKLKSRTSDGDDNGA